MIGKWVVSAWGGSETHPMRLGNQDGTALHSMSLITTTANVVGSSVPLNSTRITALSDSNPNSTVVIRDAEREREIAKLSAEEDVLS